MSFSCYRFRSEVRRREKARRSRSFNETSCNRRVKQTQQWTDQCRLVHSIHNNSRHFISIFNAKLNQLFRVNQNCRKSFFHFFIVHENDFERERESSGNILSVRVQWRFVRLHWTEFDMTKVSTRMKSIVCCLDFSNWLSMLNLENTLFSRFETILWMKTSKSMGILV
jgi:hypothetical protein